MSTHRSRVTAEWKREGRAFAVWLRERAMELNLNSLDLCIRLYGPKMRKDKPTIHTRSGNVSDWLLGRVRPAAKTLDRTAQAFNVSREKIEQAMRRDVSRARLMPIARNEVPRVEWCDEPSALFPLHSIRLAEKRSVDRLSPPARLELYRGVYLRAREPSDPENTIILEVLMNVPLAVAAQVSGLLYQFYDANHVQAEPPSNVEPDNAPEPASEPDARMTDADPEFADSLDGREAEPRDTAAADELEVNQMLSQAAHADDARRGAG